jgi:uncharacterized membrane protein
VQVDAAPERTASENQAQESAVTAASSTPTTIRRRVGDFLRSIRNDKWAVFLIPAFIAYVVAWSYLSILKFYSLHATVFDLGLEMEQLWKFVHPVGYSATSYALMALYQPFQFILSPISLPVSYPLILIVQSIGLGSGVFAVYGISRSVLKSPTGSFCLSLAYLLYFPLAGVNWFDFHAQAFFIPLFLWAFFCYVTRRYRLAFVLFLLAGGTTYSYIVLIVLFSGLTVVELALRKGILHEAWDAREWKFSVILLIVSAAFFLYQFLFYSYVVGITFTQNALVVSGSIPIVNRLGVIAFLLGSVLLLPAFSPKWLAMLAPFCYLEFRSAAPAFDFSTIFQIQYTALAIPFIFVGTIYGIRSVNRLLSPTPKTLQPEEGTPRPATGFFRRPSPTTSLAITVLVVLVGFAMVFQPYGPLNSRGPDNFGTATATAVNWTYFDEYTRLTSLIPAGTEYVLFQNSMPSVLPRPLGYRGAPFVTGFEDWLNVTNVDAATNQFPLELVQGFRVVVPIDFVISDPNTHWYTLGHNNSMYTFFSTLYSSGYYGLEGEADGMTLLARGYQGPLEYYQPFSGNLRSTDLYIDNSTKLSTGPMLSQTNETTQIAWHSRAYPLSPGTYRVAFSLMTSDLDQNNTLSLVASENDTDLVLANQTVTGANFTQTGAWTTVYLTLRLTNAYDDLEFSARGVKWSGTISIRAISVVETAPPSPTGSPTAP